jgi:predicted RND superfamily exporter protein
MFKKKPSHLKLLENSFGPKSRNIKDFFLNLEFFDPVVQKIRSSDKNVKLLSFVFGLFFLLAAATAAFEIPSLSTSYSIKQFFPKGHSLYKEAEEIQNTFFLEENAGYLMVLTLPDRASSKNGWLRPSQIQTLKKISQKIEKLPHVKSVLSLSGVQDLFETQEELTIGPIFDNVSPTQWKNYVTHQPLISQQLISKDFASTLVVIEPEILSPEALVTLSEKITALVHKADPALKIEMGGVPAIQGQFSKSLLSELQLYLTLSFVIFCLVFFVLIRGFGSLFLVFCTLLLGNILTLGTLAALKIPFSVLTTALPIILSLAIVSLSIHCLHLWAQRLEWMNSSKSSHSLSERFFLSFEVLKELALSNFLGSLTTAIGFVCLVKSSVPLIRQFGLTVALAVMGGWVLTHLVFFSFMFLVTPRLPKRLFLSATWPLYPLRFGKKTVFAVLFCCLMLFAGGSQIQFSGRLFDDLPKNQDVRKVTEKIDQRFGGVVSYDLVLKSKKDHFFKDRKNALKIARLEKELRALPGVGSSATFTDLLGKKGRSSAEKMAETLFLFTLSSQNPLRNYVTEDGKHLRFALRLHDLPADQVKALRKEITARTQAVFPQAQVMESGLSVRAHVINEEVSKSLIWGFLDSMLVIGLFLALVFRSFRWAWVACIPNFISPAFLLGVMALSATPIKPTVALVFSISLGLAFNNTVYLLGRLKKICGSARPSAQHLRQALMQEASPCLSETLLMFFGFMIFLSSSFQLNQIFGVYMLLSIFSAFIGDLFFLPVLLKTFPGLLGKETQAPETSDTSDAPVDVLPRVAAALALVICSAFILSTVKVQAAPSHEVKELLSKVQKKVEAKDDQATVKMVIREANGQTKEREMTLQTMRGDQFYARVNILSPADVKGTRFLAQISKEDENQWIYLPSTKKVRRVVGGNKDAGILGSELTMQDLDPSALRSSHVTVASKDASKIVLQVIPQKGSSPYSKVLTAISAKEYVPLRTLYYKGNKIVKTVDFKDYKKVSGGVWRAQKVSVKNLENKRGTELVLSDIKTNSGLSKNDFSQNALKFN